MLSKFHIYSNIACYFAFQTNWTHPWRLLEQDRFMILTSENIKILCAHMCTGILCMYSVLKRRWGRLANKKVLSSNFQCLYYIGGGGGVVET